MGVVAFATHTHTHTLNTCVPISAMRGHTGSGSSKRDVVAPESGAPWITLRPSLALVGDNFARSGPTCRSLFRLGRRQLAMGGIAPAWRQTMLGRSSLLGPASSRALRPLSLSVSTPEELFIIPKSVMLVQVQLGCGFSQCRCPWRASAFVLPLTLLSTWDCNEGSTARAHSLSVGPLGQAAGVLGLRDA